MPGNVPPPQIVELKAGGPDDPVVSKNPIDTATARLAL
jgi:hypothetical protein